MGYKRRRKKTKFPVKKRLAIMGISVLVTLIAFVVIMGMNGFFNINVGYDDYDNLVKVDKQTGKINILAAGLDKDGTRTDTILVFSCDLDNNKVNVLSVPRDTRMHIGKGYQKINSAYGIPQNGKIRGVDGTIEAVTRLTAIPINYFIVFTFDTFRETVDALGGVDFDVPQNMNYDDPYQNLHIHLTKGMQHLDGDKAEQLVRFRRYPMGDIDRVKVQQTFIKALAEQKLNASIIGKLPELFKVLQKDVKTNFKMSDITRYAPNLSELSSEDIEMYSLPGWSDDKTYGASYWIADISGIKELVENTFGYDASDVTYKAAGEKNSEQSSKKTDTKSEGKKSNSNTKESGSNKTQDTKSKGSDDSKTSDSDEKKSDGKKDTGSEDKEADGKKDTGAKDSDSKKDQDDSDSDPDTKKDSDSGVKAGSRDSNDRETEKTESNENGKTGGDNKEIKGESEKQSDSDKEEKSESKPDKNSGSDSDYTKI